MALIAKARKRNLRDSSLRVPSPLPDVLAAHGLAHLGEVFRAEEIDSTENVAELDLAELRQLFTDVPVGQLLKARRVCKECDASPLSREEEEPPTLASAFLVYKQRLLANGSMDSGQLREDMLYLYEVLVVISTLFASLTIGFLFDLHGECSDGSDCSDLRSIDAIAWTLCFLTYFLSVLCGMFGIVSVIVMRGADLERFLAEHFLVAMLPLTFLVFGNHFLVAALYTRMRIQLKGAALSSVVSAAVGSSPLIFLAGGWTCALAFFKITLQQPWARVMCAILGTFGFSSRICHGGAGDRADPGLKTEAGMASEPTAAEAKRQSI